MIGDTETTYGKISFLCCGIGHMDVFGISHTDVIDDIPIDSMRLFGEPIMPPVIGDLETPPARRCGVMESPPFIGEIPIGPARNCGDMETPPVIGESEMQLVLGDSHTPPVLGDMETTHRALLTGVIPIGALPA